MFNSYYKVVGGNKVKGEIDTSGSKNASFPLLASMLLFQGTMTYINIPDIIDIKIMIGILKALGVTIKSVQGKKIEFFIPEKVNYVIPEWLGSQIKRRTVFDWSTFVP